MKNIITFLTILIMIVGVYGTDSETISMFSFSLGNYYPEIGLSRSDSLVSSSLAINQGASAGNRYFQLPYAGNYTLDLYFTGYDSGDIISKFNYAGTDTQIAVINEGHIRINNTFFSMGVFKITDAGTGHSLTFYKNSTYIRHDIENTENYYSEMNLSKGAYFNFFLLTQVAQGSNQQLTEIINPDDDVYYAQNIRNQSEYSYRFSSLIQCSLTGSGLTNLKVRNSDPTKSTIYQEYDLWVYLNEYITPTFGNYYPSNEKIITLNPSDIQYFEITPEPIANVKLIAWEIDGEIQNFSATSFSYNFNSSINGIHRIRAIIVDNCGNFPYMEWTVIVGNSVTLSGHVTDYESNNGINLATVTVKCITSNVSASAFTDESGYYVIQGLPAGNFELKASKMGYKEDSTQKTFTFSNVTNPTYAIQNFYLETNTPYIFNNTFYFHIVNSSEYKILKGLTKFEYYENGVLVLRIDNNLTTYILNGYANETHELVNDSYVNIRTLGHLLYTTTIGGVTLPTLQQIVTVKSYKDGLFSFRHNTYGYSIDEWNINQKQNFWFIDYVNVSGMDNYSINWKVIDPVRAPIDQVQVTFAGKGRNPIIVYSNVTGDINASVPYGTYDISFIKNGYESYLIEQYTIKENCYSGMYCYLETVLVPSTNLNNAKITGRVTDCTMDITDNKIGISGAKITFTNENNSYFAYTDDRGYYQIDIRSSANYTIEYYHPFYQTPEPIHLPLQVGYNLEKCLIKSAYTYSLQIKTYLNNVSLPDASCSIINITEQEVFSGKTDQSGSIKIDLVKGTYNVDCSYSTYSKTKGVNLDKNKIIELYLDSESSSAIENTAKNSGIPYGQKGFEDFWKTDGFTVLFIVIFGFIIMGFLLAGRELVSGKQ